ncbi:tetratricopeptide repeat protein [Methylomonas sp. SURF-2]|uniref:Tetratricopeptide repeat protein n=1 Tax=Methylomonas subterranea TaxID=2952225 RepID=A0ABT1THC0_9GAMM|nr:tetratricopeptide repeat protein [Methylomonas sp. SURF-2]MCQ8104855.1 tetratricopeptide repeat protein [Methylomonas sp. SURF-2]
MKPLPKNPQAGELQALHQLYQSGQLALAEHRALALSTHYPKSAALLNLLGMCQQGQGKLREAAATFRKVLTLDPAIAELHFNLAAIYTQLHDVKAAMASYRKALQLKPDFSVAHFNLGALLQQQDQLAEAAKHYQQAARAQADFFEAWVNWGAVMQLRGDLQAAEQCYRKALALHDDAKGHFNLGTTLYGQGEHAAAMTEFREALRLDPQMADAWNDIGEIYRDQGDMEAAVRSYRQALQTQPSHARANYNLGECYCLGGQLEQAVPYFAASDFADARERVLQCLYKTGQFEAFKQSLDQLADSTPHHSILLGTLSTHYAINFRQPNSYRFCRNPMDFVLHTRIEELAIPDSPLLNQLLHDITHLAIAERKQGRLYYGKQSAGNLLQRAEPSFQKLAGLIRAKVKAYQKQFAGSQDSLIRLFPKQLEFASSWYLRMRQGGYLTSHIHEEGWISGCVYLQLPDKCGGHEGSFEYGTDGDDYPRLHDEFPSRIVDQAVGDLVLFPSSLFHRTIPFQSDQERVCVAFDIKPGVA